MFTKLKNNIKNDPVLNTTTRGQFEVAEGGHIQWHFQQTLYF